MSEADKLSDTRKEIGPRFVVTARVQLTVEIISTQPWAEDVKLPQVWKQAVEDALRQVQGHFHIIGIPKVTTVLVEKGGA